MSRDPRASFWIIVYFAQLFTKISKKILRDEDKCGDSRKWKKHWVAVQKNWNFEKIHFFWASLRVFEYIKLLSRISNSARQSAEHGAQAHQITGAYGNGEARKLQRKVKDRNTKKRGAWRGSNSLHSRHICVALQIYIGWVADLQQNPKLLQDFLARSRSDHAQTCTDSQPKCAASLVKVSPLDSIFTACKSGKTENLLFIFRPGPSFTPKYSLFHFFDDKIEISCIFCPRMIWKIKNQKKVLEDTLRFRILVHVRTSPLKKNPLYLTTTLMIKFPLFRCALVIASKSAHLHVSGFDGADQDWISPTRSLPQQYFLWNLS